MRADEEGEEKEEGYVAQKRTPSAGRMSTLCLFRCGYGLLSKETQRRTNQVRNDERRPNVTESSDVTMVPLNPSP